MRKSEAEAEQAIRDTKAMYGDNHWWESDDLRTIGYYQLETKILLVPFARFHEGLELLLGRGVQTFELGVNYEGIKQEAQAAWEGRPYSDKMREAEENKALDALIERKGKDKVIVVTDY